MWLSDLIFIAPTWVLVLVALLPPAGVALALRPYARKSPKSAPTTMQSTVFGLTSTGFVFFTALGVNTLWSQVFEISEKWRRFVQAGNELQRIIDQNVPRSSATIDGLLQSAVSLRSDDTVLRSPLRNSVFTWDEFDAAIYQALEVAPPGFVSRQIEGTFKTFKDAGHDYLLKLDLPGLPDIDYFAVTVMGMLVAGMLAMYPPARPTRLSSLMLFLAILVVGILQLPMWVMNDASFLRMLTSSEIFGQEYTYGWGTQLVAVATFFTVLFCLAVLLNFTGRRLNRAEDRRLVAEQDHDECGQNGGVAAEPADTHGQ